MSRDNTLSEQYENFLNSRIKPELEKFAEGRNIEITHIGDTISFNVVGTNKKLELIYKGNGENVNSLTRITEHGYKVSKLNITGYRDNEDKFLKFIIQELLFDISSSSEQIEDRDGKKLTRYSRTFKAEELIEHFRGYKNRSAFCKIDINATEYCILHEKFHSFISKYIGLELEDFTKNGSKIAILCQEDNKKNKLLIWFYNVDNKSLLGLSNSDMHCGIGGQNFDISSCIATRSEKNEQCRVKFIFGSIENQFLRFIIKKFSNKNTAIPCSDTNYKKRKQFTVEQLKKEFLGYASESDFYEINIANMVEKSPVKHCSVNTVPESTTTEGTSLVTPPLERNSNPIKPTAETLDTTAQLSPRQKTTTPTIGHSSISTPITNVSSITVTSPLEPNSTLSQAILGLFTVMSTLAPPFINTTTTPAIGYGNSTNTSIIDTNYNTTTSKPKQGDDTDIGHIAVIIGISVIMGIIFLCFMACCYWKRTCLRGCYNVQEAESLYGKNLKSGSYARFDNGSDIACKTIALSTIEEGQEEEAPSATGEEMLLLPEGKRSGTSVEVEVANEEVSTELLSAEVENADQQAFSYAINS